MSVPNSLQSIFQYDKYISGQYKLNLKQPGACNTFSAAKQQFIVL